MKASWVPYFTALGFSPAMAYRLMPIVGTVDILNGVAVLLSPCRALLLWMASWTLFTSLLRPLAGEGFWETLERAGNYGVPMAFLVMSGWARSWREWFEPIVPRPMPAPGAPRMARVALLLRLTTGLLLIGHGGYGAFMHKQMLVDQYASAGLAVIPIALPGLVGGIGWFEILLGLSVIVAPHPALLLFIFAWKIATETLYPVSGAPIWEFIERGGSYGAPLALWLLESRRRVRVPADQPLPFPAKEAVSWEGAEESGRVR
jgi:hypothetical protein